MLEGALKNCDLNLLKNAKSTRMPFSMSGFYSSIPNVLVLFLSLSNNFLKYFGNTLAGIAFNRMSNATTIGAVTHSV